MCIFTSGFLQEHGVSRELLENVKKATKPQKNRITKENPKKITKRGKRKQNETTLNIFSLNVFSLKPKLKSFKNELKRTNSSIFTLQETHYKTKGKVQIEEFEVFESIRKHKEKGGSMIGAHKALKPVLITEYNDPFELIVIEISIAGKEIRVLTGWGPQET